jgi:hypothetical protein
MVIVLCARAGRESKTVIKKRNPLAFVFSQTGCKQAGILRCMCVAVNCINYFLKGFKTVNSFKGRSAGGIKCTGFPNEQMKQDSNVLLYRPAEIKRCK